MEKYNVLRLLVEIFGTCMFCYQMENAVSKLYDVPMVISATTMSVNDITPPLILVCPLNQYNLTKLKAYGYANEYKFLRGQVDSSTNVFSWGSHKNKTYKELTDEILDVKDLENIEKLLNVSDPILPFVKQRVTNLYYGNCLELNLGSLNVLWVRSNKNITHDLQVFISDKNKQNKFSIDLTSQVGDIMTVHSQKIFLETLRVKIVVHDNTATAEKENCDPSPTYNMSQCIEIRLFQKLLYPNM